MKTNKELIAICRDLINRLCQPRDAIGKREWLMSLPADRDRDPDLLWAECLDRLEAADARIAELEARDTGILCSDCSTQLVRNAFLYCPACKKCEPSVPVSKLEPFVDLLMHSPGRRLGEALINLIDEVKKRG